MRLVKFDKLQYIPASHEDQDDPGNLKKVLIKSSDVIEGKLQMVNWAKIPVGKAFRKHYHEDMQEIFIIVSGRAEMTVDGKSVSLIKGDTVIVPIGKMHTLKNTGNEELGYVVMGIAQGANGKTVVVE